jgi:hypothetical protein
MNISREGRKGRKGKETRSCNSPFPVIPINIMKTSTECFFIVLCIFIAFLPLDKKRARACWAKAVLLIIATIGIAHAAIEIALNSGWLIANCQLSGWLSLARGLLIGFILSLVFSRQMLGTKQAKAEKT